MLFLRNTFISGRIWLNQKIRFFIAHHFRLSTLTGNEHIFKEKHLKILKRSTHTWPPLNNVPLMPGPLYARCSTHTWTSFLPAFHSNRDPILKMFHSYLNPIIMNVPIIPGPPLYCLLQHRWPLIAMCIIILHIVMYRQHYVWKILSDIVMSEKYENLSTT